MPQCQPEKDTSAHFHVITILPHMLIEYICYDDGCHLRKFARHPSRRDITVTAQKLASMEIVIDKLHMTGHIDTWCLANCDPHLFNDLDNVRSCVYIHCIYIYRTGCGCLHFYLQCFYVYMYIFQVDTEVCEQTFSWLSRYGKMTKRMNRSRFFFFLLYMCDLHNLREEKKLTRGHYM